MTPRRASASSVDRVLRFAILLNGRGQLRVQEAATGETVHLMVLEGTGARSSTVSKDGMRCASRSGELYPTALPLTLDARGPELAALRRELATVRRRGYAINAEQSEQGVNAIGGCVRDRDRHAVAAVVLAAPSARSPSRRLTEFVPRLQATAAAIAVAPG